MGKGSDAPDPPDYAAAAREQGIANVNSAIASNYMNQINQVGPNGSLIFNQTGSYTLPDGTTIPLTTATTTLSPEQQALYDQNNQISQALNQTALEGIGYVRDAALQPPNLSGLPSLTGGLAGTAFDGTIDPTQNSIQGSYDFSNVSDMPTLESFNTQRDQITDAYMQRLQPYLDRQREQMDAKLATQGITAGSEAWGWDNDVLNRSQNDQRIAALLAGDQQQQNLFNNALGLRQQGVSEAVSQGNFNNQAQAQEFGQNAQRTQAANTAAEATFAQGLAGASFGNQARQQALQEQDYLRNAPLNMLNALRTGNQVMMPQFSNVSNGANIAPAPVYSAAQDQYAAAMQQYNAQLQQRSALLGGIGSLGSAAILSSESRVKKNIEPLWELPSGLMVYAFEYIGSVVRQIGVMVEEVRLLLPEALGPVVCGIQTVDYRKVR